MATEDWITLTRADGRPLTVQKSHVSGFSPHKTEPELTLIWLMGRASDDSTAINESMEDVARALGAH